ncbi:FecR domain-containing protein, partial [bacterium]|nr:FecR domain-containing protein [bacterium]
MSERDPRTLLELHVLGELGDDDARAVEAWLAEQPDRDALLAETRQMLSELDRQLASPDGADALAERILGCLPEPRRARWPFAVAAAIAAVAVFALHQSRDRYPEPQATGTYTVADGGELRRGAVLTVGNEGAALDLGDYCRLNFDPDSVVRLAGEPRHERIFLEQGRVLCDVDGRAGQFAVETDLCTASVKGTRFIVQLDAPKGETPMLRRQALVRVLTGVVLVSGAWGQDTLTAAEEKRIAPAIGAPAAPVEKKAEDEAAERKAALKGFRGFIVGHVVGKTDTGVTLKVKAVTLIEGCTAEKPGLLLGKETPIVYALEKDEAGKDAPAKRLVGAVDHIEKMPAFAFGGFGGGNAVIVMGGGDEGAM